MNKSPAQIALNWVTKRPGVTSTIVGATKPAQLDANLAAIDFDLPADLLSRLDSVSAIEMVHPYAFFTETKQSRINGGASVCPWRPASLTAGLGGDNKREAGNAAHTK